MDPVRITSLVPHKLMKTLDQLTDKKLARHEVAHRELLAFYTGTLINASGGRIIGRSLLTHDPAATMENMVRAPNMTLLLQQISMSLELSDALRYYKVSLNLMWGMENADLSNVVSTAPEMPFPVVVLEFEEDVLWGMWDSGLCPVSAIVVSAVDKSVLTMSMLSPQSDVPTTVVLPIGDESVVRASAQNHVMINSSQAYTIRVFDQDYVRDEAAFALYRLVLGTLHYLSAENAVVVRRFAKNHYKLSKYAHSVLNLETYLAGKELFLPKGLQVRTESTGRKKYATRQFQKSWVVRGHFRWQAHGPGHSLRRLRYIDAYIKGPKDQLVESRTYKT